MSKFFLILICCFIAYIFGSFNFAIFISKKFYNKNIKKIGSKNGGTTNVFVNLGKLPAAFTLLGDCLKGFFAVLISFLICFKTFGKDGYFYIKYVVLIFAVIGHIFPIFHKFKGGKGIAVTAGALIFIDLKVFLTLLTIFILVFKFSRIVSLSALCGSIFLPMLNFTYNYLNYNVSTKATLISTIFSTIVSIFLISAHKDNIKRLLEKKETKIKKWG